MGENGHCHTDDMLLQLMDYAKEADLPEARNYIVKFLMKYFADIRSEEKVKEWRIYNTYAHLEMLALRATMLFAESEESWIKELREQYLVLRGIEPVVQLQESLASHTSHHPTLRDEVKDVIRTAIYPYSDSRTSGLDYIMNLYFQRFWEKVGIRQGLHRALMKSDVETLTGTFGETNLLIQLREGETDRTFFVFNRGENYITYLKECREELAMTAQLRGYYALFADALAMVADVTEHYDPSLPASIWKREWIVRPANLHKEG